MATKAKSEIKFGTDGWRGVISDNFTFKNVAIVGQAISEWIKRDTKVKKTEASKRGQRAATHEASSRRVLAFL